MSCCWGLCFACLGVAFSSARGPAVPSLGNPAHVRNRRPACGTRWSPSRCCARPIRICTCCRWVHDPIGWHCTPSDWVRCPLTGAVLLALLLRYLLSRCPGAVARPRDRHTRACGSEWSISKPGQALPPPPGTDSAPEYCSCPFCSLRNLAGVVVACVKQSRCLTGAGSQNDRKCAGDGSFCACQFQIARRLTEQIGDTFIEMLRD